MMISLVRRAHEGSDCRWAHVFFQRVDPSVLNPLVEALIMLAVRWFRLLTSHLLI